MSDKLDSDNRFYWLKEILHNLTETLLKFIVYFGITPLAMLAA